MKPAEQLTIPAAAEALTTVQTPNVGQMLNTLIERGVTQENAGALEKMLELYERLERRDAEKQFNAAFVALQNDLPVIVAETVIPNRGKYQKFEDVCRVVNPLLAKHGFSVSFSMTAVDNRITETCHLKHIAGHSQSNSFAVRVGRADSETQADCKAATTAKRNALLNCLNIVIRQDVYQNEDQDGSLEGEMISEDKADYLKELVKSTGSDEAAFLRFAQAKTYDDIAAASYDRLVAALHKKQRA